MSAAAEHHFRELRRLAAPERARNVNADDRRGRAVAKITVFVDAFPSNLIPGL